MSLKDERMKVMNETLSGIKVLILSLNIVFVTITVYVSLHNNDFVLELTFQLICHVVNSHS